VAGLTRHWLELTPTPPTTWSAWAVAASGGRAVAAGGWWRGTALPGIGSLVGRLARDWATEVTADGRESLEVTLG